MIIIKKGFKLLLSILAIITIIIGGLFIIAVEAIRSLAKKIKGDKKKPTLYKYESAKLTPKTQV